ncbi:hypothetical protein LBMAG56_19330 [Verrucomicrobiota bacterium]|nr:hypothetical protein LBMAG56_19330 [Verrucomicrobiota bacterium]
MITNENGFVSWHGMMVDHPFSGQVKNLNPVSSPSRCAREHRRAKKRPARVLEKSGNENQCVDWIPAADV